MTRRTISYKDKSKKKRRNSKAASKVSATDLPTPMEEGGERQEEGHAKTPNNKKYKHSFQKMAKIVKLTRSVSDRGHRGGGEDNVDHMINTAIPEVPEEAVEGAAEKNSSSSDPSISQQHSPMSSPAIDKSRKKRPPPRPSDITLKKDSQTPLVQDYPTVTLTPSLDSSPYSTAFPDEGEGSTQPQRTKPHPKLSWSEEEESHAMKSRQSPHRLTSKIRSRPHPLAGDDGDEEFFGINYIHMCAWGLWLCVGNNGGNVMAFDFCTKPIKRQKQSGVSWLG